MFLCTCALRTYGSDLFVVGLGEIGVISADVCALADAGGFKRKTDEEDGEGLAFPVHVQDDAGARVRGRHPAADFLVLGRDVVACDLGSASMFRSTVGRELGKGGHWLLCSGRLRAHRKCCLRLLQSLQGNWVASNLHVDSSVQINAFRGNEYIGFIDSARYFLWP